MHEERTTQIVFFAPFVSSAMRLEPGWIDYNGHLNMAYYHVLFDRGGDEALELLGLGPDYLKARGGSTFAAETHVLYRRELHLDHPVRITLQMIDCDEKRLHVYQEIRHAEEGWVSATCETMFLHMDMAARRVAPFPSDILANLRAMEASHARMPRPEAVGRTIAVPSRRTGPQARRAAG